MSSWRHICAVLVDREMARKRKQRAKILHGKGIRMLGLRCNAEGTESNGEAEYY